MRIRLTFICGLAALALAATGCGGGGTETATFTVDAPPPGETEDAAEEGGDEEGGGAGDGEKPNVRVPSGPPPDELQTDDLREGDGATAEEGDEVTVEYVGVTYSEGEEFDTSYGREPFTFTLGEGQVIEGWDEGVAGMQVGGRRQLTIPPDMAYGAQGSPPAIGPNETLVFVVDLVDVE